MTKTKPAKHKDKNIFKFQTFTERLANVSVDVVHNLQAARGDVPEDRETWFEETLDKWADMCLSEGFTKLVEEIGAKGNTLAELLLHKEELVQVLLRHLEIRNAAYLQPLLELVVALARDLKREFQDYFPKFFEVIIANLNTRDAEQLEWSFTSLAYMYKALVKFLVQNIKTTYKLQRFLLDSNQPEHVRVFAAESFALLGRKVLDKKGFVDILFTDISSNSERVEGVGQLLFEIIRGVKNQLHSCSEAYLKILFSSLNRSDYDRESVKQSLSHMVVGLTKYLDAKGAQPLLNSLFEHARESRGSPEYSEGILQLIHQVATYQNGILVSDVVQVVKLVGEFLDGEVALTEDAKTCVVDIAATLIVSSRLKMQLEHTSTLIKLVYTSSVIPAEAVAAFTQQMTSFHLFESHVLPHFLTYCHKMVVMDEASFDNVLETVARLVHTKRPLPLERLQVEGWKPYPLEFTFAIKKLSSNKTLQKSFPELCAKFLEEFQLSTLLENQENIILIAYILPHLRPLNVERCKKSLQHVFSVILHHLDKTFVSCVSQKVTVKRRKSTVEQEEIKVIPPMDKSMEKICLLLSVAASSLAVLESVNVDVALVESVCFRNTVTKSNISLLRVLGLVLGGSELSDDKLKFFYAELKDNLSSPYRQVRLLTLHILSSFSPQLPTPPENTHYEPIFKLCLAAEEVELTVQTQREKQKYLQRLDAEHIRFSLPLGGTYDTVPVLYLVSQLFANYKPMWDPVIKLLVTHAHADYFWEAFIKHVRLVTEISKVEQDETMESLFEDGVLVEVMTEWVEKETRIDYKNARALLWRAMTFFADVAEKKNRELVPMFFQFLETEYYREDASVAKSQDISMKEDGETPRKKRKTGKAKQSKVENVKKGESEEEPMEVDGVEDPESNAGKSTSEMENGVEAKENGEIKKNARQRKNLITDKKISRKGAVKLLCAYLSVFAKFTQPRNMYQEEQFRKILDQFLAHRNDNVQRLALDCLMAYNYKYIVTYKKNLYGLLDDKNFRHQIVLFNIDSESDVVQMEHREGLMPVVMRLLYGRMHGKAKAARQAIILRFLGGSSDSEIKTFFDLAFNLFIPYLNGELTEELEQILASADLKHALPLKRLQAALNMIGLIFHKLGNLIQQTLPWLLKLLLVIGGHVVGLLQRRNEVEPVYVDMLKQLRNLFIQRVTDFFIKFEKYAWSLSELNAICRTAVSPQLNQLPSESFASPTPLMKLLIVWSQNPRYFPLLAKIDQSGTYPVSEMVKVLTSGKASGGVTNLIMEAFERLVTLEDFSGKIDEDDEGIPELPVEGMVDLSSVDLSRIQEPLNFGSRLLSLHVTSILRYLQTEVTRTSKGSKKGLSTRDLTVLMRLAEFVSDPEQSTKLAGIIIPAINAGYDVRSSDSWGEGKGGSKKLTEEQTDYLLSTLALLMKNLPNAKEHFRVLLPLLGKISSRSSRSNLCNVFAAIGQSDPEALKLSNQIAAVNAFDPKRMDEPDFTRRLDAYKEINAELTSGTASLDTVLMVIYNSSFSLRIEDDMSLRDSASFSLQNIATYLPQIDENQAKGIVTNHLLPQVRQLFRSKKEPVRHEAVTILAVLVQKCADLHPQLKDLSKLSDPDPEMDFFENMRHLQGHRRARALVKVAARLKETPRLLHADTLTQFLMPLASVYLFSEVYVKQSHLVDAAIETMNAIAKNLPWFSYEKILRYYLQQLVKRAEYQKQAVRATVAILDGFHFDLTNSKAVVRKAVDQPAAETEEEARPEEIEDLAEVVESKEESAKEEPSASETTTHTVVPTEVTASKIHDTIMRTILPQLHRLLTARSKRDSEHKVNRGQGYYPEDEEILRVPLALAMAALLRGLPRGTLERNLPGIFMKICTFLKSRADSIRETARDTLVKIMNFLGPAHLYTLVRESNAILKRGFQVHVLIFTLHAVLHNILPQVKVGDLGGVLPQLVQLCIQELFGDTSEEKEVAQIVAKVKEAKGHKSYDLLNMLAKFVSQNRLMPLVTPFKDVLITTKSHKVIRKIEDCYYHIATGLAANESIPLQSELVFIHGIVTESIPQWFPKQSEVKEVKPTLEKPDSFLIQPEPKRKSAAVTGKENAKTGMKTHAHVITEFALQLLHLRLKKETIEADNKAILAMLDPFIPILADSLASPHNKQIGLALRCLTKLLCLPLPSVEKNIKRICGSVFTILKKYSGPGSAQGDQYEMVVSAYKLITVIIRDVSTMRLENDQLRVLLTYAEQSLSDVDSNSQATGFAVLKAILGRKLEFPELPDVMQRIAKLAVTSDIAHVRSQCRQLMLQYLIDYPLGKKVIRQIQFFLGQLEYDREDGRLSALEFLDSVFGTFPKSLLNGNAPLLFVTLSPRLVNEQSKTCLKMVAGVLRKLLSNLEEPMRNELFQIVTLWMQDENIFHKIIAAQLAAIFIEVEGPRFESRLKEFLPLLEATLEDETSGDLQKDKLLIQLLIATSKLFTTSPVLIRSSLTVPVWREIQKHLLHEQITVRLLCARLIGLLFAAFTPEEVAEFVKTKRCAKDVSVFENPVERLRTLALDCSDQLSPLNVDGEIAEQAIKNLLFLYKIATRTESSDENEDDEESPEQKKKLFGVRWYMKRIRKEINSEIAENPNCGVKRIAAFQFYAAALLDLHQTAGSDAVKEYLPTLLPPIIREISISEDKPTPELAELATLARETAEFLKQLVGHETYMEVLASCRKIMNKKKIVRKAEKSQRAVMNPGLAAKLKMKKQASKKDAKKKKIALLKGKVVKRKKLKDVAVLEE